MLATVPTITNRIASHFTPTPIPVPATPDANAAAWSDAVFAAMMFYQSQLAHPDERVAERAAKAIFDLEKTRLRHGGELAGATVPRPKPEPHSSMEPLRALAPIEEPCGDDAEDAVEEEIDDAPVAFNEKERAAIEAMVRHPRYAPIIEKMRTKLVSQGVNVDDARRLATEAFRQHVGQAILERRQRVAAEHVGGCRAGFSSGRNRAG